MAEVEITLVRTSGGRIGVELRDSETIVNGVARAGSAVGFAELMGDRNVATLTRDMDEDDVEALVGRLDGVVIRELE